MSNQPTALRLADSQDCVTDDNCGYCMPCSVAAELRRLHEAHDWQYRMAGERLRRVEKLEAQRDALLAALERIAQLSMSQFLIPYDMAAEACNIARAAIKAVEENT